MKKTFFGSGNSLKEAKMACSEEAILVLGPAIAKKSRQTIQQRRPIYDLDDEEEEEIEGMPYITVCSPGESILGLCRAENFPARAGPGQKISPKNRPGPGRAKTCFSKNILELQNDKMEQGRCSDP